MTQPRTSARGAVLRCAGYHPEGTVYTRALRQLECEFARANGAVRLEMTPNITELGHKAVDLLGMVASGEFDLCYFNTSYLVELIPSLRIFDLPFLIFDRADIFGKLDGTLGKLLAAEVARLTPYRVLGFWDNGFRHMSNRVRPIARVQDCRGLRFRTVDSRLHQEVFSAFGFDPVHIDVRDLPRAAASLTIDGQENPLTNTLNLGIHRIQRYQTLTHHFFGAMAFLANADAIAALPAAVRDALGSAVEHATSMQRTLAAEADNLCYRKLVDEGCDFVAHNELELSGFKSAAKPICDRELRLIPPDIRRAFEA